MKKFFWFVLAVFVVVFSTRVYAFYSSDKVEVFGVVDLERRLGCCHFGEKFHAINIGKDINLYDCSSEKHDNHT